MKNDVAEIIVELKNDGFHGESLFCALTYAVSRIVGPNLKLINRYVEGLIPDEILSKVSWRLRANGIWRGGMVYSEASKDADPLEASVAMVLECMCASGEVVRDYDRKENWKKWNGYQEAYAEAKR